MQTFLFTLAIGVAVLAVVLYLELKATQSRLEMLSSEVERRVEANVQQLVTRSVSQLPEIERRVEFIERSLANREARERLQQGVREPGDVTAQDGRP
jgi:5-formaminoimidazole-4-carboxamide-1-beta-D-ribofuranosyl 5'-monophosphate synthetase